MLVPDGDPARTELRIPNGREAVIPSTDSDRADGRTNGRTGRAAGGEHVSLIDAKNDPVSRVTARAVSQFSLATLARARFAKMDTAEIIERVLRCF